MLLMLNIDCDKCCNRNWKLMPVCEWVNNINIALLAFFWFSFYQFVFFIFQYKVLCHSDKANIYWYILFSDWTRCLDDRLSSTFSLSWFFFWKKAKNECNESSSFTLFVFAPFLLCTDIMMSEQILYWYFSFSIPFLLWFFQFLFSFHLFLSCVRLLLSFPISFYYIPFSICCLFFILLNIWKII